MPELWTIKEITQFVRVSKRTIFRWIKEGSFPAPCVQIVGTQRWTDEQVRSSAAFIRPRRVFTNERHKKRIGALRAAAECGESDSCNLVALLDSIGQPELEFPGSVVKNMRQSVVYAWVRDDKVLYVGRGSGVVRPFYAHHHRLRDIQDTDKLLIWYVASLAHAVRLEADLIERLRPVHNRRPTKRVANVEGILSAG